MAKVRGTVKALLDIDRVMNSPDLDQTELPIADRWR
jgi:hypothetical protein